MDFANNLLNQGISLNLKKVPVEQNFEESIQPRRVIHSKEVFITNSEDKNCIFQLGFIKESRPSKWLITFKSEELINSNYFGENQPGIGSEFVNNQIKYKITKKVSSQIEIVVKSIENKETSIIVPLSDTINLVGITKNENVVLCKSLKSYLKKEIKSVPNIQNKVVYVGIVNENKIDILRTEITKGEISNAIIMLSNLLKKSIEILLKEELLIEFVSCILDVKEKNIIKNFKSVVDDFPNVKIRDVLKSEILKEKISKIDSFRIEESMEKEVDNTNISELVNDILAGNDLKIQDLKYRTLESMYYVNNSGNKYYKKYGFLEKITPESYVASYNNKMEISPKNLIYNKNEKNLSSAIIKGGPFKDKTVKIVDIQDEWYTLEINGKKINNFKNKKITRKNFIYADIFLGHQDYAQVLSIDKNDMLTIKNKNGKTKTVNLYEVKTNGVKFYTESELKNENEQEFVIENINEVEREEQTQMESYLDVEDDMKSGFKDRDRLQIMYDPPNKNQIVIKQKLDSLLNTMKLYIVENDVYVLRDEINLIYMNLLKKFKDTEEEEYFTLSSTSMKYIYALIIYRYLIKSGQNKVSSVSNLAYLLYDNAYLRDSDVFRNVWNNDKTNSNGKEKIKQMLINAEKYLVETVGVVKWDVQELDTSDAILLGHPNKKRRVNELVTKYSWKGKTKNYTFAILGKTYDSKDKNENEEEKLVKKLKEVLLNKHFVELSKKEGNEGSSKDYKRADLNSQMYKRLYDSMDDLDSSMRKMEINEDKKDDKLNKICITNLQKIKSTLEDKLNDETDSTGLPLKLVNIINSDFDLKSKSAFNKKNLDKKEIEHTRAETKELAKKINLQRNAIINKFKKALLEKISAEKNVERKELEELIVKNIKNLDAFIYSLKEKESPSLMDTELIKYSEKVNAQIKNSISEKIKEKFDQIEKPKEEESSSEESSSEGEESSSEENVNEDLLRYKKDQNKRIENRLKEMLKNKY